MCFQGSSAEMLRCKIPGKDALLTVYLSPKDTEVYGAEIEADMQKSLGLDIELDWDETL
jgi:hypothetical protein